MDGTADTAGDAAESRTYSGPAFTSAVEDEFRTILGGALRTARKSRKMSLEDAARATGQVTNTVSWHEKGKTAIPVPRFVQYCIAYGLPPGALLDSALEEATGVRPPDTVTVDLEKLAQSGNPLASWAEAWLRNLPSYMQCRLRLTRPAQDRIAELSGWSREQLLGLLEAKPQFPQ
ncbi:helix-turn-helix transcriptional regulator [Amycolatopsis rubida]|uniref:Helix-turn-helix transcriptional regulator n=1 Tax=Amycolatopsis rubida TaxID=112413 RepID=A0ABX0C4Z4_9PSEU|nr:MULTISPECIES: helix-turn-helix transcriptional regulator [Amycolatopsis]MYW94966.1 helix-turn-helix domain-containing protein [Amycolatopsis rubida]NEC59953.1 helix-turn-helix transcriptional regulator [Amycolatopsis rubida]OAP19941.1 Helix-turn-helix domain protein [Amycolatopsis sp. M39]